MCAVLFSPSEHTTYFSNRKQSKFFNRRTDFRHGKSKREKSKRGFIECMCSECFSRAIEQYRLKMFSPNATQTNFQIQRKISNVSVPKFSNIFSDENIFPTPPFAWHANIFRSRQITICRSSKTFLSFKQKSLISLKALSFKHHQCTSFQPTNVSAWNILQFSNARSITIDHQIKCQNKISKFASFTTRTMLIVFQFRNYFV